MKEKLFIINRYYKEFLGLLKVQRCALVLITVIFIERPIKALY